MAGRKTLGLLVALAIGVVGGVTVTTMAAHAWRLRSAHTDGTMALMQHHVARLRDAVRRSQCDAIDAPRHFARLAAVAPEIEFAFADRYKRDAEFVAHFRTLTDVLANTQPSSEAALDCATLDRLLTPVQDACEACHRDYR